MADLHLRKTTSQVVVARWAAIPRHAALLSVTTQLNRKKQHATTLPTTCDNLPLAHVDSGRERCGNYEPEEMSPPPTGTAIHPYESVRSNQLRPPRATVGSWTSQ